MNALIFGHVCIDRNDSEQAKYIAAGSPAMFINKIYKQFPNLTVSIAASYGPDYIKYFQNVNIYPKSPNSNATLIYENISKGGIRTQKALNRKDALPILLSKELKTFSQNADIIFFAPLLPNYSADYVGKITSVTRRSSVKILLPQGYFRNFDSGNNVITRKFEEADEVLRSIDVVIVSEQDHPKIKQMARKWVTKHPLICVVTLGEKGAVAFKGNQEIPLSTKPVAPKDIVDSVGAGDVFSAAFAYTYQQTHNVKQAGLFANKLARQFLLKGIVSF